MKEKIKQKGFIQILVIGLIVIAGIIWLSFGTLNPCEMLKKEIKPIITEIAGEEMEKISQSGDVWEQLGASLGYTLGMALVDPLVDNIVNELSPIQCFNRLIAIKFEGKEAIKNKLKADISLELKKELKK